MKLISVLNALEIKSLRGIFLKENNKELWLEHVHDMSYKQIMFRNDSQMDPY